MNILKQNGEIIYLKSDNYDKTYDDMLFEYLVKIHNSKILKINEIECKDYFTSFEKLLLFLEWIKECSIHHKIQLNNKKDTKDFEKLFKYGEENL